MTISVPPPQTQPIPPNSGASYVAPVVVPEPQEDTSVNGRFERAVSTAHKDTGALDSLADEHEGTIVGDAIKEVADTAKSRKDQFNRFTNGVDPSTPEGRITLGNNLKKISDRDLAKANGYESIADNPRWGDAVMYLMTGNKEKAMQSVMGGPYKRKIEYDDRGNALQVFTNDLGDYYVKDANNNMIPQAKYLQNHGSRSLENTLYRKIQENNIKPIQEAYLDEEKSANGTQSFTEAHNPMYQALEQGFRDIKNSGELTKEQKMMFLGMTSGTVSNNRSVSNGLQALYQASRSKDGSVSKEDVEAANLALGSRNVPLHYNSDGKLVNSKGEKIGANELRNSMQNFSNSEQIEKSYQQNQENLKQQYELGNLGVNAYKKMQALIDMQKQIDLDHAEFVKQGINKPFFVKETLARNTGDEMSRPIVQALQGQFNAESMNAYQNWRKNEIEKARMYDPTYTPMPKELESAFTKTDLYKNLVNKYETKKLQEINSPYVETKKPFTPGSVGTATTSTPVERPTAAPEEAKKSPIEQQRKDLANEAKEEARRKAREKNK
jgi:hypothetical protein